MLEYFDASKLATLCMYRVVLLHNLTAHHTNYIVYCMLAVILSFFLHFVEDEQKKCCEILCSVYGFRARSPSAF